MSAASTAARVYAALLGDVQHTYPADRQMAAAVTRVAPIIPAAARANRRWLVEVVRYLAIRGVEQFIDVGSGLPTAYNVHQVAQAINQWAHVVYVDNDPAVVIQAGAMMALTSQTAVVQADLRDPEHLLATATRHLIHSQRPTALILCAVLHLLPDEDGPFEIVKWLVDRLPAGSFLVISHALHSPDLKRAAEVYTASTTALRSAEEIRMFFRGTSLLPPGLVGVHEWRPQPDPTIGLDERRLRSGPVFPDLESRDVVPVVGGVGLIRP